MLELGVDDLGGLDELSELVQEEVDVLRESLQGGPGILELLLGLQDNFLTIFCVNQWHEISFRCLR